ncbi:ATP synthase (F/14-kDa) subunit-domain-containing protein [Xylaria sp. FL0043]|nr:ATP synthase (F/14-kDa) subunit-domain-containing protein [Xylaria sp. FL0043]
MLCVEARCGISNGGADFPRRIRPDNQLFTPSRKQTSKQLLTMAASQADYKDRQFLAVIGDEDSVTGLLLAGIGHVTNPPDSQKNFLVVDSKTETSAIEAAFESFTTQRKDIGIVLINQHVADKIRHRIDTYTAAFPTILEIPSKEHPYDPEKDSVLRRVRRLFGE